VRRRPVNRASVGQVRLIGGRWRGRRLEVIEAPGLRPSPDRLRETLFNWLAPRLPGANCLDLFAGTGALGFEAASRGAASVTLVERHPVAADALRASVGMLDAGDTVSVVQGDAGDALDGISGGAGSGARLDARDWDIVFIDPPFERGGQAQVLARLLEGGLAPDARVHVESAVGDESVLPDGFEVLRDKRFGQARARLLTPLPGPLPGPGS